MNRPGTTGRAAEVLAGLDELRPELHRTYRTLHANPELSMQEHRTAELIENRLAREGVPTFRCATTGVVGVLENGPGPVVAFRADTDALPLAERTGLEYASTAHGTLPDGSSTEVMHACGHDTHTAALLSAATLLGRTREAWAGTVMLIFQPGEETAAGAAGMLEDGLWERAPLPEVLLGQHVGPGPAGSVRYRSGVTASTADSWEVTMYGRGAHGSQPHHGIDPIVQVAHTITRLQGITAREVDPLESAVVTVGKVAGGTKENIIPDSAMFTVNVRTFDERRRERVLAALRRVVNAEAAASGAPEPAVSELSGFPSLVNDESVTEHTVAGLSGYRPDWDVARGEPLMGSEDFGLLGDTVGVPYCYWFIGGNDPEEHLGAETGGTTSSAPPGNHSPMFAPVQEPTLSRMVEAAVVSMLSFLGTGK